MLIRTSGPWYFYFLIFLITMSVNAKEDMNSGGASERAKAIKEFVSKHNTNKVYSDAQLINLFMQQTPNEKVIAAISRPAESLTWQRYRKLLVTDKRVSEGVAFWRQNKKLIEQVAKKFKVPPEIVVAIVGVETSYGKNQGKYSVLNSLYTLGFHYPKALSRQRSGFFKKELAQFLQLASEQAWPLESLTKVKGSYAGAMGMGQFIASSYRNFAVDGNDDGRIDLFKSKQDALASVANYFQRHKWQAGEPIAKIIKNLGSNKGKGTEQGLKDPKQTVSELLEQGMELKDNNVGIAHKGLKAVIYSFDGQSEPEHWLTFKNFYVITRYNHSPLYAMAVYQLSERIREQL